MSRLWRNFIEKVMDGNPQTKNDILYMQLDAEHKEYHYLRQEWINGNRSPLTHSIKEWEQLGKPSPEDSLKG